MVTFDAAHGVWLATTLGIGIADSAILVARSTDGVHWSRPVTATRADERRGGVVLDKEWIACDNQPASPFLGHCYVSYSDFVGGPAVHADLARTAGLTWGAPTGSPDLAGSDGMAQEAPAPQPMTNPLGVLTIPIFEGDRMSAVRSLDGGATFTPETTIAPVADARRRSARRRCRAAPGTGARCTSRGRTG